MRDLASSPLPHAALAVTVAGKGSVLWPSSSRAPHIPRGPGGLRSRRWSSQASWTPVVAPPSSHFFTLSCWLVTAQPTESHLPAVRKAAALVPDI